MTNLAYPDDFLDFWGDYPRRTAKGAAFKAWQKLKPSKKTCAAIHTALEWQKASRDWRKEGGQYVPMPSTYLNQRRWEDEPPEVEGALLYLDTLNLPSKRALAMSVLAGWGEGDWLRTGIAQGLQALVAQALKGQPGADTIAFTADIWYGTLKGIMVIDLLDAPRLAKGFRKLLGEVVEWPQPKMLIGMLPSRPPQAALPGHRLTDEEFEAGKQKARELRELLEGKGVASGES